MSQYTDGLTVQQRVAQFNAPRTGPIIPNSCPHCERLRKALQEIIAGDPAGGTYSGSQCVEIAKAAL